MNSISSKMKAVLDESDDEGRRLFWRSVEAVKERASLCRFTDQPDFRGNHPHNNVVFISVQKTKTKNPFMEVRVDGCPKPHYISASIVPERIAHHFVGKKDSWAVFRINSSEDVRAVSEVVDRIAGYNPPWRPQNR